jgi:hypothetical protein
VIRPEEEAIIVATRRRLRWWYVLLAIPFAALLYPPLYARHDP